MASIHPLQPLKPDLHERAWVSVPHPTLPLLATAHAKGVTVFSLSTLSAHSTLTGGHTRSVRSVTWEPGLPPQKLCLVTGSFDSTAGLWRWEGDGDGGVDDEGGSAMEMEMTTSEPRGRNRPNGRKGLHSDDKYNNYDNNEDDDDESRNSGGSGDDKDWEFTLVLEGHESEIKSCVFSPTGAYLATCSRDKTVWIWEDVGAGSGDDEWGTLAILNEHEGDVKAVAWCPDVPGRNARGGRCYAADVLASASYDNTVRIWREDADAEWVCVAVLEGHTGTVWGIAWEASSADADAQRFPRLLTYSADSTMRIWTLIEEEDDDDEDNKNNFGSGGGTFASIPNTMRRSLREDWRCTAILPPAHTGDIYAAAWSSTSGLVGSVGSDGTLALYREVASPASSHSADARESRTPVDEEGASTAQQQQTPSPPKDSLAANTSWELVATVPNAHGPYEVNHVAWCRRYDAAAGARRGDEMLVTTGDDGLVRPWEVRLASSAQQQTGDTEMLEAPNT